MGSPATFTDSGSSSGSSGGSAGTSNPKPGSTASPAIALETSTQAFLKLRLVDRQKLNIALQTSDFNLWDPYPYRTAPLGSYGYPGTSEITDKILNAAKKAVEAPGGQTKGSTVSLYQQHNLLESYRRNSQTGRMRKFHQLRVWVTDAVHDEKRQLSLQANLGAVTARRQAVGLT